MLLSQNLRKGTRGLTNLLQREAQEAFEERKNMAKKHYANMLKCADNTIYSGYAVDPYKMLQVHNSRKRCKLYKSSFTSIISPSVRERKRISRMERIICLVIGYDCGVLQRGYLVGKMHHIDIRKAGSGNSGSTNALRVMGLKAGLMTFAGDVLKCFA